MRSHFPRPSRAFTLIELLIVVAIIAILAAIAVPNFLEAQVRSKVARSAADLRTVATAMESYIVDHNGKPRAAFPGWTGPGYSSWWGFVPSLLTTPVAYITSLPVMPFSDATVIAFWKQLGPANTEANQPYTYLRNTWNARWPVGVSVVEPPAPPAVLRAPIPKEWRDKIEAAGYVIYTSGPDRVDGTVWGSPAFYDPTNGTISYGDVYRFGSGSPNERDFTN